jgi:hypothetical protein
MSQDYNEAVQDPALSFADPELRQGEAVTNALGIPQPFSGNFADVYALKCGPRKYAVKCFTRQIPGLQERYVEISKYLHQVALPFMVDFKFLEQGIRVRGEWYPVLKMQWVEGFCLNAFIREQLLDKPQLLQNLCQIWFKLATRLREATLAHADLQHGNVLLVPGAKAGQLGVRLVDYDGMCVRALELLKTTDRTRAEATPRQPAPSGPQQPPTTREESTFTLQVRRSYTIDANGQVQFPGERKQGQLTSDGADVVIDFKDGKIERLKIEDGKLLVEHFNPKSDYPDRVGARGMGVKVP